MFGRLKIKTGIMAILAILSSGYLVLLGIVQLSATATHSRMSGISASLFPAALRMQEAEASFERVKKHYEDAVVLQDATSLKAAGKEADVCADALGGARDALAPMPDLSKQADAILDEFNSLRTRDHQVYSAILAAKGTASDDQMAQVGALAKDNKALTDAMSGFDKTIAANFQDQLRAVDNYSLRARFTGLAMLIFAMIACTGAWWIVQRKVVMPLQALAVRMQDIAQGNGDLTRRAETHGHDEIDEVASWFNVFIGRIEQIVRSVALNANQLDLAAADLARSARETAAQAEEQQNQAARIATTMNEMSSAVREISVTTQSAAEDARKAEESAHTGGETTRATANSIREALQANQATSAKIEELGQSSGAIGKIVHVIDNIAAQTNLLALNASIEAARAGEHGRGFAVVAGEVRRLAERTSVATKEISQTISAIQTGTSEAVEAMRSSMRHVETGVESARSAGESLESIIRGAESVQKMVTQIASAATEQSYSTQSVNNNVNEIVKIVERTAESSQRSVEACESLSKLASGLTQLMSEFKVDAQDPPGNSGSNDPAPALQLYPAQRTKPLGSPSLAA
jgi:methyl-accepting chemotaxis protein